MGIFDKLFQKKEEIPVVNVEKGKLYAPLTGRVVPMEEIPDAIFSQGILGKGCGIEPEIGEVVAPVNGTVSVIAETKHAVGINTEDGAELLIHVGMDTVNMKGEGFSPKVSVGQKVVCGQKLLAFDMDAIKKAGYPITTAFVVTNSDDFSTIQFSVNKQVKATEEIGEIKK